MPACIMHHSSSVTSYIAWDIKPMNTSHAVANMLLHLVGLVGTIVLNPAPE
jgi:hypothetical protein